MRWVIFVLASVLEAQNPGLRAGASQLDVNPRNLPVVVNCGFLERSGADVRGGGLFARAIVLAHGSTRLAITAVDSCMMPRELLDRAKRMASERTGIPADRMLISATHTHSAPAAMACLGSREQKDYADWLPGRIAEAIAEAASKLEPARVGAESILAPEHTFCRRWIYKPGKMLRDPFGELSVRANMIPGFENPDAVTPAGPVDAELSVVAFQSIASGKPIAVLANFSNHYFGSSGVSPDYFGLFDTGLAAKIGGGVVMMTQGTSGDANTSNYAKPKATWTIDDYANGLIDKALQAYRKIQYTAGIPLEMAEATLPLTRRLADSKRIAWAEQLVRDQKGITPANQPEVYAHEQLFLRDAPTRELKLQAIRIGEIGLTAIPNEVYAITGLKLKAQSPLGRTINIELANGAEGYIPPPEQHPFGGYTTWAARTAGLEPGAEPKIVENLLILLEAVSDRRRIAPALPAHLRQTLARKPIAYWPLEDFTHGSAADVAAGGQFPATHTGRAALYLDGAAGRGVYLAGGSLDAKVKAAGKRYTVEFWFWPGVEQQDGAELLSINGSAAIRMPAAVAPKVWHHAALLVDGSAARIWIDGKAAGSAAVTGALESIRVGAGFEGKIDEVAVYGRAIPASKLYLPNRFSK
jgi:hypothetical protein